MMDALQKLLIRPSRHIYTLKDLGPAKFILSQREVHRQDITIRNKDNKRIEASCFLFEQLQNTKEIIVYLHCNSGSRVQGAAHARQVLEAGYAFMIFDFCGSGLSQGDFITLGANEALDIEAIVSYIKSNNAQAKIILWGRSMGAVASLLYLYKHHLQVNVAILDSPFCSLRELALHIGNSQTSLPNFMLEGFIRLLNNHVKEKTKLDLLNCLSLKHIMDCIPNPALFLGSKTDTLVPFSHIETLYSQYSGYKEIYYLEQDHHERRSQQTVSFALKFISRHLQNPQKTHKKTLSNISSLYTNNPKHSVSQMDFRISLQPCKKIELIAKSARRREDDPKEYQSGREWKGIKVKEKCINLNSKSTFNKKSHKDYFAKANQEKRKFIHLVDRNAMSYVEEKSIGYSTDSMKLIRNQTDFLKCTNTWKREPIKLCKRNKAKFRSPLKDIVMN